jgi:hypothetical protein
MSNMTGVTNGARNACPSGATEEVVLIILLSSVFCLWTIVWGEGGIISEERVGIDYGLKIPVVSCDTDIP